MSFIKMNTVYNYYSGTPDVKVHKKYVHLYRDDTETVSEIRMTEYALDGKTISQQLVQFEQPTAYKDGEKNIITSFFENGLIMDVKNEKEVIPKLKSY